MLQSLASSNYASTHPLPIDPAVFFDLVKVRHLVENATDLAVRAANGTTSSSLSNSLSAANGISGGAGAATLGFGVIGGGSNTKLSRERKYRMRELATQKLSRAYHLDEIAASVATMQSASSLEEVAKLVLQRSMNDPDAKYVHFFHEKIPSRMLAQYTDLGPLDEIIQDRPAEAPLLRTRGLTKTFKEDFVGAVRDFSDGLALCRCIVAQHKSGRGQLELVSSTGGPERKYGSRRGSAYEVKVEEEDQPSSLETQLLFHRAGVYLTLACQNVRPALDGVDTAAGLQNSGKSHVESETPRASIAQDAQSQHLYAHKLVKANAKRALRDYMNFLSNFEYTPGVSAGSANELCHKVTTFADPNSRDTEEPTTRLLEMSENCGVNNTNLNSSIIHTRHVNDHHQGKAGALRNNISYPAHPLREVYPVSALFSSSPPSDLPPFPPSQVLIPRKQSPQPQFYDQLATLSAQTGSREAVTYHPLLIDALHSLLLCHSLLQTSLKEHLRHAYMVARLARVCDGYPIFLAGRSPSRADWIEVLRQTNNWVGLQPSWDTLCTPAPLPGHGGLAEAEETEEEVRDRHRQEAILEALADERVHDEASFQATVAARERRAEEQRREDLGQAGGSPSKCPQKNENVYPICTERAEVVARWVNEAPQAVEGSRRDKNSAKKGKKGKKPP